MNAARKGKTSAQQSASHFVPSKANTNQDTANNVPNGKELQNLAKLHKVDRRKKGMKERTG